jgi:hypothetical protein
VNYLKLEECVKGHVYRLIARNFSVGVFDGRDGFIGIRTKFGSRYLFTEYHYDAAAFPTARPLKLLGVVPDSISLDISLGTINEPDGRRVAFDKPEASGGRGWYYVDDGEHVDDLCPVNVPNTALFNYIEKIMDSHNEQE